MPSTVAKWNMFEFEAAGPADGNPYIDVTFAADFSKGNRVVPVPGFYDGDGVYRLRFMPDDEGSWTFRTRSNRSELDGLSGGFDCTAAEPGAEAWADRWTALAGQSRRKQLEYSWIRAVAGAHADFWQVTQDALDWALQAEALADPQLRQRLLDLYFELPAFPEVPEVLRRLRDQGYALAILSNGSPAMLSSINAARRGPSPAAIR